MLSKEQIAHGKAIARRRAINGLPNGYRPYTEVELRAMVKAQARLEVAALLGSKTRRETLKEDALEENVARHLASGGRAA